MNPAFLKIQVINPNLVKVTIVDERASPDLAQATIPGVPPPVHQPKELFSFYADPDTIASSFWNRLKQPIAVKVDPS